MSLFEGKSPRWHLWVCLLATWGGRMAFEAAATQWTRDVVQPTAVVLLLAVLACWAVVVIRRLNDVERSRWWALVLVIPPVNLALILGLLFVSGTTSGIREPQQKRFAAPTERTIQDEADSKSEVHGRTRQSIMKDRPNKSTRNIGWVWIVLSPIIFLMGAISTVKSLDIYNAQLAIFSAVSFAALAYGVAAVAGASWAPRGLLILSWLGSVCFFVPGLLMALFALMGVHASSADFLAFLGIAAGVAATGVPFFLMARSLHATGRNREKLDAS